MSDATRIEGRTEASAPRRPLLRPLPAGRREPGTTLAALLVAIDSAAEPAPEVDDGAFFRALDESHPDRPSHEAWY